MTIQELNCIKQDIFDLEDILDEKNRLLVKGIKELKPVYCPNCHTYYEQSEVLVSSHIETHVETIIGDCGYGDDDIIADVTRVYLSKKCPKCKDIISSIDHIKSIENERKRR